MECRRRLGLANSLGLLGAALVIFLISLLIGVLCCLGLPVAVGLPSLMLPGMLVAESLITECEAGTMESLLLTPADRERILWAKYAARLRPMFRLSAIMPALGALIGVLLGAAVYEDVSPGRGLRGAAAGLGWGAMAGVVAGALLLAQSTAGGSLAFHAVLKGGTRTASFGYVLLYSLAVCAGELVLLGVGGALVGMAAWTVAAASDDEYAAAVLAVCLGCGLAGVHVYLVGFLVPPWLVRGAARNLDRSLLSRN